MPEEIFVLNKAIRLLQPEGGFRTSLDSVILAAACPAKAGDRVLDLGCGVGGATFSLRHRISGVLVQGIDKEAEYIELARQNIALNSDTGRCEFTLDDIREFRFSSPDQRVEHVICNPPFLPAGTYTPSPDDLRAAALGHTDDDIDLKDWIDCAFHNLQPGGSLTMIHRADAVDKIIQEMGRRYGQIEIFPLWPRQGEAAKRVVVRARKDRRSPAVIHAGLVLHNADGSYTAAAELVLRAGHALF
ncbi:MAG: tRNA1(Val) (adenine(37)-N6)-methyltransferase [Micavibrio sp.]